MSKVTKSPPESPRIFWLKLPANFFDQGTMLGLEGMANSERLQLIWIKLLLFCLKRAPREAEAGFLRISELIPCDEQILSKVLRVDLDSFRVAFKIYTDFEMLEVLPDNTIFVPEIDGLIGSETTSAERKRRSRANVKRLKESAVTASSGRVTKSQRAVTLSPHKEVEEEYKRIGTSPPFEGDVPQEQEENEMDLQRKATEDLMHQLTRRGLS
jgi:predicted phage replisome organizer